MTYRVAISDCMPQFHRAHEALIESLGGAHHLARSSIRGQNHWSLLELNWKQKYNVDPVGNNGSWKYLDFASEKHYTAFILKWS